MPSQIADTENALLALLQDCRLPTGTLIQSVPNEWDDGMPRRLISKTPAVLLAFLGARPHATGDKSTSLNLMAEWGVYCCVGWNGKGQQERRHAVDGGYDLVARVAPILHNALIHDPQNARLPFPEVVEIENIMDAPLDIGGLWISAIRVEVELPLDIPEDCEGPLDDFLRLRATVDIPGGKPLPDIADAGDEALSDSAIHIDYPAP